MSEIFLKIVNMSISASWIVLTVLLLRLLLKRAPKWITVLLWGIVGIRLIFPFSIVSMVSIIPSAEVISPEIMTTETPEINTGIPIINNAINPILSESFTPSLGASANPLQIWIPISALVWGMGIGILLIYTAVSYWRVNKKVTDAILLYDNIYQCEHIPSPFVLGIIKPKIYIPFSLSEKEQTHVVAHEQAHLHRKDHLWKPFGFLLLTLHWFNPLMWLAYILLCRDIELACDEKVIQELDVEQRADYSQVLLNFSVNHRMITACPLAFGEVDVKERVRNVLNYKKPAFWLMAIAIIVIVITSVCLLTDPKSHPSLDADETPESNYITDLNDNLKTFLDTQVEEHKKTAATENNFVAVSYDVMAIDESDSKTIIYMWVLNMEYSWVYNTLNEESTLHTPVVVTAQKNGDTYELLEYWKPRDDEQFSNDIKSKFPENLWLDALDSHRTLAKQKKECRYQAIPYFANTNREPVADVIEDEWGITMALHVKSDNNVNLVITQSSKNAAINGRLYVDAGSVSQIKALYNGEYISIIDYAIEMGINRHQIYVLDAAFYMDASITIIRRDIPKDEAIVMDTYLSQGYEYLPAGTYIYCVPVSLYTDSGELKTKMYTIPFVVGDEQN